MRLTLERLEARVDGATATARVRGAGAVAIGPITVELADGSGAAPGGWRVANPGDGPVTLEAIALVFRLDDVREPLRIFRHGWQSWSASGVATLGVDRDPSLEAASIQLVRDLYHADPAPVGHADELRSEWVTVLADADPRGAPLLLGFDAGTAHDGTIRVRRAAGVEVRVEAFLGGCVLEPGAHRDLHTVVVDDRADAAIGAGERLERWAADVGRRGRARIAAPYRTGWCSWYHYFHAVTEADLRANLARAVDWPFDVFQLDDGFQHAIGDWLRANARFPSGVDGVARLVAAAGRLPGLWLAPFLVAPDSEVARAHPDWLARDVGGEEPLLGMLNSPWGGGRDGWMYVLDTTQAVVQAHLEHLARSLVAAGYTYLKLDFTYAAGLAGRFADCHRTPAERVRDGFAAVRRGAGDATFLLACGAPLAPAVGIVDGVRIGPDVAPRWGLPPERALVPAYADCEPATRNAFRNTLARAFMHRQLWLNDPDCLLLRAVSTELSPAAARTWAHAVAVSGGMALVSDDLALLDAPARATFDEVIAIGRASDAAAAAGRPARAPDLLDRSVPGRLDAAGWQLAVDPDTASSDLRHRPT